MLLAKQVVLEGILAVVGLLAGLADAFKVDLVSLRCISSTSPKDLFSEDIGGNRW